MLLSLCIEVGRDYEVFVRTIARTGAGRGVSRVFTNECDGVGAVATDRTVREIFVRAQVAAMLHT